MAALQPLHDNIVIRPDEPLTQTSSGLLIAGAASDHPAQGEVIAVGPGKYLEDGSIQPMQVAVGNKVVFSKGTGQEVKVDGENLLVMKEDYLLAIIV